MPESDNNRPPLLEHPTVFFDGVCGLCDHTVNWLLGQDSRHVLRFAPLQGTTASAVLPRELRERLDTLVFAERGAIHIRSGAVSRILLTLRGRWWVPGMLLWIIPYPLRDIGYRIVARVRYRLFGKRDACRLPTPSERAVFLD